MGANSKEIAKYLWRKRDILFIILTPLLLSPILILNYESKAARCGFVLLLLLIYWVTLAVPLPVTGIMVLVWLPLLELLPMTEVERKFMSDFIVLFMGIIFISTAVEKYQLHRRIALRVLLLAGSRPKWLLLALMSIVMFLSMWILNVPLLLMMLPIVKALIEQLEISEYPEKFKVEANGKLDVTQNTSISEDVTFEMETVENGSVNDTAISHITKEEEVNIHSKSTTAALITEDDEEHSPLRTCFYIGLVYASTIGGAASLYGTLAQAVMLSFLESSYGTEAKVTFGEWLMFAFPVQVICLIICWGWLTFYYLSDIKCCRGRNQDTTDSGEKKSKENERRIIKVLRKEYDDLGNTTWAEGVILILFGCLILVWFFENPSFMTGWQSFFTPGYVTNATITMGVVAICFILPRSRPSIDLHGPKTSYEPLLQWRYVQTHADWGIMFFIGSILSVSEAMKVSGLDDAIGQKFEVIKNWTPWVLLLSTTLVATVLTELLSSSMVITLLFPVLKYAAAIQGVHPYYYVIAMTLGVNFSFCLPAGNLGNAVVVTGGYAKLSQLLKSGLFMNIAGLILVNIAMNTYGIWVLDLKNLPDWALAVDVGEPNVTTTVTMEISSLP